MDFDELLLNKITKTNKNLKRIVAIIMSDFYQLIFKQKNINIKSLNQLLYPSSKTFFNSGHDNVFPVLLERIIIY